MRLSVFGEQLCNNSGILQLMDDLGKAMAGEKEMLMLGGGNPAHIPEVQAVIKERMREILEDEEEFRSVVGNYDTPQGEARFIAALAGLLRKHFGWPVSEKNIALTNGSQSSFFLLFNALAGRFADGSRRRILLPLTPEYIGYADAGIEEDFFVSTRPQIEFIDEVTFKYHVDFGALPTDDIGAMCVSRPTNPTGNVLTDEEITHLNEFAKELGVPLIIDNAYGTPFPHIIFTEATPLWDENTIVCMSLSKLGLPTARTGIVVASEEVIRMVCAMNAITGLAPGSFGAALALKMVEDGGILEISRSVIEPFYRSKAMKAFEQFAEELDGVPFRIHKPEGAMFLWLWFEGLPITTAELYERLKARGVLVVPGHYFFPGLKEEWRHKQECIRVTYSQDDEIVSRGITVIAEEVKKAYRSG